MKHIILLTIATLMACFTMFAQENNSMSDADKPDIRYNISADGSKYIKFTFMNQTWLRYNQSNPGTTILGKPETQTFDIGLRRTRMQLFGQIAERTFFYTQFGMNNFNFLSNIGGNRKLAAFFHDALGEYHVFNGKNTLKIGAGLTIATGVSRFTQPSVATIMTLDVPVFAQTTNDQIDEFSRRLSIYARGQVGKLDYRLVVSDPFPITTNGNTPPLLGKDASFTTYGHSHQYAGFFMFNFFESEPHTTPYMQGTYMGQKKILNLELGVTFQPRATWMQGDTNSVTGGYDTVFNNLIHASAALYLDMPLNKQKGTALSAYLGFFYLDYGKNYIRNNGIMNPANGVNSNGRFNGAGNAYPMFGTGTYLYGQFGYLLRNKLLGSAGTLMPFISCQYASLQKINDPVIVVDAGINWLISGHNSKISIDWQSRPVFNPDTMGKIIQDSRKSCVILQYQVYF